MAHASTHGARKPPGPINFIIFFHTENVTPNCQEEEQKLLLTIMNISIHEQLKQDTSMIMIQTQKLKEQNYSKNVNKYVFASVRTCLVKILVGQSL